MLLTSCRRCASKRHYQIKHQIPQTHTSFCGGAGTSRVPLLLLACPHADHVCTLPHQHVHLIPPLRFLGPVISHYHKYENCGCLKGYFVRELCIGSLSFLWRYPAVAFENECRSQNNVRRLRLGPTEKGHLRIVKKVYLDFGTLMK